MEIKAVKFRKNGFYSQPFAFGGEDGPQNYDINIRYRGSLQNYLIDTGTEGFSHSLFFQRRGVRIM